MLSSLTKFMIKTRMKSPRYAFYFILFLLSIFVNFIYFQYDFPRPYILKYMVIILISTIIIIPLFKSGNVMIKSDNDFLLDIPLNKKNLFKSYFFVSFIVYSPVFILFLYFIGLSLNSYKIIIGIFNSFLLYLISIGLSYIFSYISNKKYPLILFIIYLLSPLIYNYKFNINSVFFGNIIYGTVSSLIIFILIFYYIFSRSYKLNFLTYDKQSEKTYKPRNLKGKPVNAIYKLNTIYSNTVYAFGISKKRYHFPRNIFLLLIIYSVIGIAYFALNYIAHFTMVPKFTAFFYVWEISIYPIIFRMGMPWASERLWLSFTSMDPYKYIKNYIAARSLSMILTISPLILSSILVYIFYPGNFNLMVLIFLLIVPASMSLMVIYTSGVSYPFQIVDLSSYPSGAFMMNNFRKTLIPSIIIMIAFISPFIIIFISYYLIFYLYAVFLVIYDFYLLSRKNIKEIENNMEFMNFI